MELLYTILPAITFGRINKATIRRWIRKTREIMERMWIVRGVIFFFELHALLTTLQFFMRVWYVFKLRENDTAAILGLFAMWVAVLVLLLLAACFREFRKTMSVLVFTGILYTSWQHALEIIQPSWANTSKTFWISFGVFALVLIATWLFGRTTIHELRRDTKDEIDLQLDNLYARFTAWYTHWPVRAGINTTLIITTLWLMNAFNLLLPYFITASDPFIIGIYSIAGDSEWRKAYDQRVQDAQFDWQPASLYTWGELFSGKYIPGTPTYDVYNRHILAAAKRYGLEKEVRAFHILIHGETRGYFMRLPGRDKHDPDKGGLELGLAHRQPKFFLETSLAWWPDWMRTKSVYNTFLEYQRARFIAFWCSFKLPWQLDLIRSHIIASIDDRLSVAEFDNIAKILYGYALQAGNGITREQAMIMGWHEGGVDKEYLPTVETYKRRYTQNGP